MQEMLFQMTDLHILTDFAFPTSNSSTIKEQVNLLNYMAVSVQKLWKTNNSSVSTAEREDSHFGFLAVIKFKIFCFQTQDGKKI